MALPALLALVLAAQAPPSPADSPSVFGGTWSGSTKASVGPDTAPCRYTPPEESQAVTLRLDAAASGGSVSLDLPASGALCPAVKQSYKVVDARAAGNSLTLSDDAGHEWSLTLREGRLKGLVSGGDLSGSVDLGPTVEADDAAGEAPADTTPSPAPPKAAGGSVLKGAGGFVAANVVALGALVGLNQALKDTQQSTKAPSCSPRSCIVIGSDCNCPTGNQVEGGSCGSTANGVLYGGACSLPALPCQSTLSCNNGICDDVRCPVGASALTKP